MVVVRVKRDVVLMVPPYSVALMISSPQRYPFHYGANISKLWYFSPSPGHNLVTKVCFLSTSACALVIVPKPRLETYLIPDKTLILGGAFGRGIGYASYLDTGVKLYIF